MGLFDFLKKKDKIDEKALAPVKRTLSRIDYKIHSDIEDLIWLINGPKRNYNPKEHIESSEFYVGDLKFRIEFSYSGAIEPSAIDTELVIAEFKGLNGVDKLPYYPSYSGITPGQRGSYLEFLSNPYDTSFEIGYAFILYYGLERFLLTDKFERAFEAIIKLRDVYENQSFQFYSGNALVLSCLYHQRPDMMLRFITSIDKEHELAFSDNLFLLSAYSFGIPVYSRDIIRLAKTFEFSNKNYINKYPELFNEIMTAIIKEKYKKDSILLSDILNKKEFNKLRAEEVSMFANISISDKKVKVPLLSESFKLKKTFYDLLEETHESVKVELVELRKKGNPPKQTKSEPKEKKILTFDEHEEKRLLDELNINYKNLLQRHFSYIQLQNFYYKFRDNDNIYLEKCIKYCDEDIRILNDMQKEYVATELKDLERISDFYDKKEFESRKRDIERGFKGNIPAFKRLAIIYEKSKEYDKAVEICHMAIQYYKNLNIDTSEFEDRKLKLLNKSK